MQPNAKLLHKYNANNVVLEDDDYYYFMSYYTLIAKYKKNSDNLYFTNSWNYSRTTLTYLYKFLFEYTCISVRIDESVYGIQTALNRTSNKRKLLDDLIKTNQIIIFG